MFEYQEAWGRYGHSSEESAVACWGGGVEMWVKIYSPNVQAIEVVKRAEKKAKRARLYYMRYVFFFVLLLLCFFHYCGVC